MIIRSLIASVAVCIFTSVSAISATINVAQESAPGAGDFGANILGTINSFSTALTAAQFYNWGDPSNPVVGILTSAYNGHLNGGPPAVSNQTTMFFVNAADGLSLFVVHDRPGSSSGPDSTGSKARNLWNISNDTADFLVKDDINDGYSVASGGAELETNNQSNFNKTDGYVIGALDGLLWSMLGQFTRNPEGIGSWVALSSNLSGISLDLVAERRVQFMLSDVAPIPLPASLPLFLAALAGLGLIHRRRRRTV